jgi:hypothetical protein
MPQKRDKRGMSLDAKDRQIAMAANDSGRIANIGSNIHYGGIRVFPCDYAGHLAKYPVVELEPLLVDLQQMIRR